MVETSKKEIPTKQEDPCKEGHKLGEYLFTTVINSKLTDVYECARNKMHICYGNVRPLSPLS